MAALHLIVFALAVSTGLSAVVTSRDIPKYTILGPSIGLPNPGAVDPEIELPAFLPGVPAPVDEEKEEVIILPVIPGLPAPIEEPVIIPGLPAPIEEEEPVIIPGLPAAPQPSCVTYIKKLLEAIIVRLPELPSIIPGLPAPEEPEVIPGLPAPEGPQVIPGLPAPELNANSCTACFEYIQTLIIKANMKIIR